ncbi:MAG TPA: hypothetical protein VFX28_06505, partial [Methylomirabilota bacterium]|nr:hypothetical protein [Methylomirabilota bacterium]
SEAPAGATPGGMAVALPKPNLYGVVLREGTPIAYLEDPATKRVAGYRVGDSIGGGTVQAINADGVVLARPEGQVDVWLRDPAKPRPVQPVAVPPGAVGAVPGAGLVPSPGVGAPAQVIQPPVQMIQPPVQGGSPPVAGGSPIPGRRQLPPNLLRRIPPGSTSNAPQE